MSTPIKGPGSATSGAPASIGVEKPQARPSTERFQETLRKDADPISKAQGPEHVNLGATARLGSELQSGQTTAAAAVEKLLENALQGGVASSLSPAAKAELERHLRQALADDPSLQELLRDLERSQQG